jgi:hypothetical protein
MPVALSRADRAAGRRLVSRWGGAGTAAGGGAAFGAFPGTGGLGGLAAFGGFGGLDGPPLAPGPRWRATGCGAPPRAVRVPVPPVGAGATTRAGAETGVVPVPRRLSPCRPGRGGRRRGGRPRRCDGSPRSDRLWPNWAARHPAGRAGARARAVRALREVDPRGAHSAPGGLVTAGGRVAPAGARDARAPGLHVQDRAAGRRRDVAAGSRAPEVEQEEGGKRGDDHAGGEAKAG